MGDCCVVEPTMPMSPTRCPECGRPGRVVQRITAKAMLRPTALMRLSAPEHRFCSTPACRVVYFGTGEIFDREEIVVPVLQKEPEGDRTICYCFAITEGDIRREVAETGRAEAVERITALVKAERCACEVKNPQGSCCLGNVAAITRAVTMATFSEERGPGAGGCDRTDRGAGMRGLTEPPSRCDPPTVPVGPSLPGADVVVR